MCAEEFFGVLLRVCGLFPCRATITPCNCFFAVVEGGLYGLVRDVGSNIAPQRQAFDGKTVSFPGSAPHFVEV